MIFFLLLFFCALTADSVFADTFQVWPDSSIQRAVDSTTDGDTILIHEGLYQETVVVCAKRLIIGSEFLLDSDTSHISRTIIEPDSSRPDSHSCFIYARYATYDDGKLIGLKMRNGGGSLWEDADPGASAGGAVFIRRANVAIEHCMIENSSADFGGGIAVIGASIPYRVDIHSTSITHCRGLFCGGIKAVRCSLYVVECYVQSDTGDTAVGGIDVTDSYAEIRNCIIQRCGGQFVGGMLYGGSSGSITGSLFEENGTANDYNAHSHLLFGESDAEISGCVFRDNTTSE
ncbi:MAG: hypothetical protein PHI18_10840, partial [bacterium]|nr:hypothetical protein [bacterium]